MDKVVKMTTGIDEPRGKFANLCKHLRTITRHKCEVAKLMFAAGLYVQGLAHDLSKYSPTELKTGARFYQGYRSPNAAERQLYGFSTAWLHHQGRNKHHFEYWIDPAMEDSGKIMTPAPMPMRYIIEMFCDRVAACKVYEGAAYTQASPLNYYNRGAARIIMHPDTRAVLEAMLEYLAQNGEECTFRAIRTGIVWEGWSFGENARF